MPAHVTPGDVCVDCDPSAGVRGVFIKSTGKVFSAGADLEWMKRTAGYTREQNLEDAVRDPPAVAS